MQSRFTRERLQVAQEPLHLVLNSGVLLIRTDDVFAIAPQAICERTTHRLVRKVVVQPPDHPLNVCGNRQRPRDSGFRYAFNSL